MYKHITKTFLVFSSLLSGLILLILSFAILLDPSGGIAGLLGISLLSSNNLLVAGVISFIVSILTLGSYFLLVKNKAVAKAAMMVSSILFFIMCSVFCFAVSFQALSVIVLLFALLQLGCGAYFAFDFNNKKG